MMNSAFLRGRKCFDRATCQVQSFIRFCEAVLKHPAVNRTHFTTNYDNQTNVQEAAERLQDVK